MDTEVMTLQNLSKQLKYYWYFKFLTLTKINFVTVSGAYVPYTVRVFASTEAGQGNSVTTIVFTRHGGKRTSILDHDCG